MTPPRSILSDAVREGMIWSNGATLRVKAAAARSSAAWRTDPSSQPDERLFALFACPFWTVVKIHLNGFVGPNWRDSQPAAQ
jgi:hypothetical protein